MGEISERYMGAMPALRPELMPMRKRPTMSMTHELANLAPRRKALAATTRMLLSRRPPFL